MRFLKSGAIALSLLVAVSLAGCSNKQAAATQDVAVNTFKISAENTVIDHEYTGTITAREKVPVNARVSGYVTEKLIRGGETVTAGQPLYRIDSRSYSASLASAQASAAQAGAAAQNAQVDLRRYEILAGQDAIARQTLDTQRSTAEQNQAAYQANEAQVRIAQDNLNDTVIRAPFSGTLNMDAVDLGTFVTAGSTSLVTIQSGDSVFVEFSMSENEYLSLVKDAKTKGLEGLTNLQIRLSDNSIYPYLGHVVEVSKSLESGSGKITLKAEFANPDHLLLPGMFATVISGNETLENAILVPTRSILQVLDKDFVLVVGADGKVSQVAIIKGATKGLYTVVSGDLKAGDQIIVDGLTKAKAGATVKATLLTKDQIAKEK